VKNVLKKEKEKNQEDIKLSLNRLKFHWDEKEVMTVIELLVKRIEKLEESSQL